MQFQLQNLDRAQALAKERNALTTIADAVNNYGQNIRVETPDGAVLDLSSERSKQFITAYMSDRLPEIDDELRSIGIAPK